MDAFSTWFSVAVGLATIASFILLMIDRIDRLSRKTSNIDSAQQHMTSNPDTQSANKDRVAMDNSRAMSAEHETTIPEIVHQSGPIKASSARSRIRRRRMLVNAGGALMLVSFAKLVFISFSPSSGGPLILGDAAGLVISATGIYIGFRMVMDG
jgi:hypothetical protein